MFFQIPFSRSLLQRTVRLFFWLFRKCQIHFNLFHVPMEIYHSLIFMSAVSLNIARLFEIRDPPFVSSPKHVTPGHRIEAGQRSQVTELIIVDSLTHPISSTEKNERRGATWAPYHAVIFNTSLNHQPFFGGILCWKIYIVSLPRHADLDDSDAPALYLHRKFSWYCFG